MMIAAMAIKYSLEGYLIYGTMAAYVAAAVVFLVATIRANRVATVIATLLYLAGFGVAVTTIVIRWHHVQHVPLQNLYEVFLCLGMLICPLSYFCRRFLRVGVFAADCAIGAIALFPAGFVFKETVVPLPPALQSWLFAPHVAAYMAAYIMMAKAAVQGIACIGAVKPDDGRLVPYELGAYKMVRLGFPLLTLGLILGAWWGKICWSDYWNWDPKELWSLISWLIFLFYLHFRYTYGKRYAGINGGLVVAGLVAIIATLLVVNLSSLFKGSLHSYAS
jgi:ABC-type transport system involved in cytochrome c biogenesis permease subunit